MHDVIVTRCAPTPVFWEVTCPECGEPVECDMREQIDRSWRCGDDFGDPFVVCQCGAVIEPVTMIVETK